ncbi:hypothetical protein [Candidatus Pelagibacter communis]|jgi:hypothetical protein|nr:hypothetical protein [Candidatus Pelagibacter ubique]
MATFRRRMGKWEVRVRRYNKKKGWQGLRILAATMGIGYVPFI